jgi:MerR family transcriptional regulator/heat shock protein HspR
MGSPSSPLDDVTAPLYTVGQVATILDVQVAFLRRLDEQEVVRPARSQGGQRRYSRRHIDRVAEVCVLVDEGLTLAAVRKVFELQARVAELEEELARERARNRRKP